MSEVAQPELFTYSNYLKFLEDLVEWRSSNGGTRAELAAAMRCQAAYFSQVLKGRVQLTEDHGVRLCAFLGFEEAETDFFLLLLRKDRAATPELRQYLDQKRERIVRERDEVESRIESETHGQIDALNVYYSADWQPSAVHIATSCEGLHTASAIATRLKLPESTVLKHLEQLAAFGLVRREGGRWIHTGKSLHFPKSSPLDPHFQLSRRLHALSSLAGRDERDLHYSVMFAADEPTLARLRVVFIEAIARMHKVVEPCPSRDVFSFTLDLFRA